MKCAVPLLLLCVVWVVLGFTQLRRGEEAGHFRPRIPDYNLSEMSDIFSRESDLDRRVERTHGFRIRNEAVKAELKAGKASLREAAGCMAPAIRKLNPELLETLGKKYAYSATEEQVALWLMGQLMAERATGELKTEEACQVECLRGELKDWLGLDDPELTRRGSW